MRELNVMLLVSGLARATRALLVEVNALEGLHPKAICEWPVANARARYLASSCAAMARRISRAAEELQAQLDAQTIGDMERRGEIPPAVGDGQAAWRDSDGYNGR